MNYWDDIFLMRSAGQLGYYTTKLFMNSLPSNDIGTNFVTDKDGRGGVVARRLNT
jgi:hypothetical protein